MQNLKATLDEFVREKNTAQGLFTAPDPLQVAKIWIQNKAKIQAKSENYKNSRRESHKSESCENENSEFVCLLCALFAYGNAKNIVNFLKKLDFSLLNESESTINSSLARLKLKYRFQSTADIAQIFITLRRLKQENSLENIFCKGYEREKSVVSGIKAFIDKVRKINTYTSLGYDFFFGKPFENEPQGPLKRYNMLLRWLVRADELDLGLWRGINKAHLLVPLDTHTHKVALKLGLMSRKSYDFKAVLELTNTLRSFDPADPIKYDFALYRLGQSKEYLNL